MELPDAKFDPLINRTDGHAPLINIGSGKDQTILELAEAIRDVIGYTGKFRFDASRPDGTYQKLMSSERINALGWRPKVSLKQGIELAYADYLKRAPS